MASELSGRVAIVTGAARGIGVAIVDALADAGAHVAVAGRDRAAAEKVAAAVRARGGTAVAVVCDVTDPAHVSALPTTVRAALGPPCIVVNNAGIAQSAKLADTDEAMWARTMDINLTGAYRVTRACIGDLLAAGPKGRVINIASVAAKVGFAYTTAYCASKHGLLGFSRALALEIAPKGVTVNCVCPGWVETDMTAETIANISAKTGKGEAYARASLENMSPQRRLMTPGEVAQVVRFLATDAAAGVTGQAWNVDGGEVMF